MKNRYLLLIVVVLAIGSGLYFFKDEIFGPKDLTVWDFVPANAVSVWETDGTIDTWNRFLDTDHWANLVSVPGVNHINAGLSYLDSLAGFDGNLDRILGSDQFLISTHVISRNQFDFSFYLKIESEEFRNLALQITDAFGKDPSILYTQRTYQNQLIIEVQKSGGSEKFSFFIRDNFFVGSFTPFLVEDAIRTITKESDSFQDLNEEAFGLTTLEFDAGDLYLNLDNISNFAGLFYSESNGAFQHLLASIRGSGFLDVDFDSNFLFASGFIIPKDSSYLEIFEGQGSVLTSDFMNFIPGNAAKIIHQGFTDARTWHLSLRQYNAGVDPEYSAKLDELTEGQGLNLERFLSWMSGHLVLIDMESVDEPGKLILIESSDIPESLNQLNRITESVNAALEDTLYYEFYGDATLKLLNIDEFPARIFGSWYSGFPVTYYTSIDNFIVFSNEPEPIKELLADRESENTWGQSVVKSEFVKLSLDESNLGVIINTAKAWNQIGSKLSSYWQEGWNQYSREIKHIEFISMQMGKTAGKYYSSFVLKHRNKISTEVSGSLARQLMAMSPGSRITKKPKVVKNHNTNGWEVLLVDSLNRLSLVATDGDLLWQDSISGFVKGDIHQIDFYRNRKLQYLLATDTLLYIIDRNGEVIDNFPVDISNIKTNSLKVIDYDKTRNYRFMFKSGDSDIYLTDKEGNILEGWSPRSFNGRFTISPFHIRVRGKDVFLGIKENGEVVMTNRRGEDMPGFPLDLDTRIIEGVFYQVRSGMDKTLITVVSEEGDIINFDLEGKVINREQLYRPAIDTRFWLVTESLGKSFVIARQDLNRLAILDRNGELLFEKDYLDNEPFEVQYYNFGADQEIVVVSGAVPGKVLIYDGNGVLKVPGINSDFPVSIIRYESRSQYHIYTAAGDSLFIYSMQE